MRLLPEVLSSDWPELLVDYLAVVFREDDDLPVPTYVTLTVPSPALGG